MKLVHLLAIALTCGTLGFARPLELSDGAYQLIRARVGEDRTGERALSAIVVSVSHKAGKIFISLDGATETEVRTDDQAGFLVSSPFHPGEKGRSATELIFAGRQLAGSDGNGPIMRVEGAYRIIYPGGEEGGSFALLPVSLKNG
jgi:hypothetical protein